MHLNRMGLLVGSLLVGSAVSYVSGLRRCFEISNRFIGDGNRVGLLVGLIGDGNRVGLLVGSVVSYAVSYVPQGP